MLGWQTALSLLVRPRCFAANRPIRSDDETVRLCEGNNRGSVQDKDWSISTDEGLRLWAISSELLVEAGIDDSTRADRR